MIRGNVGSIIGGNNPRNYYSEDDSDEEYGEEAGEEVKGNRQIDPVQFMALPYFVALSSC